MKALILGAAGFVGPYLMRHLCLDKGWSVVATKLPHESIANVPDGVTIRDLNILEQPAIEALLAETTPDVVFHLAAQSSVALSWKRPALTVDINVKGTVLLLEALRGCDRPPRLVLIGSGEEYGRLQGDAAAIPEETPLRPNNLYAATKACAETLAEIYSHAYGLWIVRVRAFNHIGPGQSDAFVAADFCRQAVEIELGLRPAVIYTGNLAPKRDFTDVRDVVRAYGLLAEHGQAGTVYNVGSGNAIAIATLLATIQTLTRVPFATKPDAEKFRPTDLPVIAADATRLRTDTGWAPQIPLEQTLADTLQDWRQTLRNPPTTKESK